MINIITDMFKGSKADRAFAYVIFSMFFTTAVLIVGVVGVIYVIFTFLTEL